MTFVCAACIRGMDPAKNPISVTLLCGHMFHKRCVEPLCKDKLKCPECNNPVNYERVVELKDILKFNGKSFKSRDIIEYVRKNFSYYDAEEYLLPLIQHISKQDSIIQQLKNSLDSAEKGSFSQFILIYYFK